jgi:phosphoserine phosphatase RsbU/P
MGVLDPGGAPGVGDVLSIFSDGVTEATNSAGEEFGENRLIAILQECQSLMPSEVITRIVGSVREFSEGAQADDLTLLLARCR